MKEKKAVKLILAARKKARIIGGMLLAFIVLAGILGWIVWKWYALVIIVVVGLLFTSAYSLLQAKQIARQTGLTFEEQEKLLKKHELLH
jgi:uncharacterized membrane protein